MRNIGATACLVGLIGLAQTGYATGDIAAGKSKSIACGACHGLKGNSTNPEWPNIAGQHGAYAAQELENFKAGRRVNPLMSAQTQMLSEQDMQDIAAYFETLPVAEGEADPALVERGEQLYRGGNTETGLAACTACHGPTGRGNPLSPYPSLSGQHATYTEAQLRAYRSGERNTDANQIMRNISSLLSDDDIRALASYIQGLRAAAENTSN